jgi:hypothetical protein
MLSPWNNRLNTTAYYNENDRNSRYHRLYRQVPNQKFDESLFFSLQSAKFNPQVSFELLATAAIFEVSTVLLLFVALLAFWTRIRFGCLPLGTRGRGRRAVFLARSLVLFRHRLRGWARDRVHCWLVGDAGPRTTRRSSDRDRLHAHDSLRCVPIERVDSLLGRS